MELSYFRFVNLSSRLGFLEILSFFFFLLWLCSGFCLRFHGCSCSLSLLLLSGGSFFLCRVNIFILLNIRSSFLIFSWRDLVVTFFLRYLGFTKDTMSSKVPFHLMVDPPPWRQELRLHFVDEVLSPEADEFSKFSSLFIDLHDLLSMRVELISVAQLLRS